MEKTLRIILFACFVFCAAVVSAQSTNIRDKYKVKKKDTIYGIAQKHHLTVDELMVRQSGDESGRICLKVR